MKVFLSSTAQDLSEYRKVADDTIRRLELNSVAMEYFGPLPGTPVEECEQLARDSDIIVCIVAHRYGYIPEEGRGSITRREVEAAHHANKDVLVWIVEDAHPWTEKKEQDLLADPSVVGDTTKVAEVATGVAGLLDFKAWLRTTFTPETFTTPDDLGRKIAVALANYIKGHAEAPISQNRISISRLPTTSSELFGRETELQLLDDAWANPNTNIVSFVAWGGVGKTALVNHWLKRRMARDNYRGAKRVYGWSFFSQGTSERAASADLFVDQALRWYGDPDPTSGSPWDKGQRLAQYIRESRTLLILDGLEPLQHPPGFQEGRLKDAAMQTLLIELAADQLGLCVITTRERVGDLIDFENNAVVHHNLEHLSAKAGAQILRSLNVKGDDDDLENAAKELGGHAFSLTLLGSYLDEVLDGDIRRRQEIENLFSDSRYGDAAQRMIAAYETWLGEGMELSLLRLLGLFDRPADAASLEALRKPPTIEGLTEPFQQVKAHALTRAASKLRRVRLLDEESTEQPGSLNAHPLVREYFKQQLKRDRPVSWRAGNGRLYEHLKASARMFPETLAEMSPLFAAVVHGCAAQRHQEAFDEVFQPRIQRGSPPFSIFQLGAIGTNLATLAHFFHEPWYEPVAELQEFDRAFLLNAAGFCLRTMGRLQEAVQPMQVSMEMWVAEQDWESAANAASNLSQLFGTIGQLHDAIGFGGKSIEFANREGGDWYMLSRATMAFALHQTGNLQEAAEYFSEAEAWQKENDPNNPLLKLFEGFLYNDLLLDKGEIEEVKARAALILQHAEQFLDLVNIGHHNLSLGRALLMEAQAKHRRPGVEAEEYLQKAVTYFRHAGFMTELPGGLLTRASLYRSLGNYELAYRDLTEMHRIASSSGMGLYLADFHLESARLALAQSDSPQAIPHFDAAKEMINRMGYHRRDKEVAELEAQLA